MFLNSGAIAAAAPAERKLRILCMHGYLQNAEVPRFLLSPSLNHTAQLNTYLLASHATRESLWFSSAYADMYTFEISPIVGQAMAWCVYKLLSLVTWV